MLYLENLKPLSEFFKNLANLYFQFFKIKTNMLNSEFVFYIQYSTFTINFILFIFFNLIIFNIIFNFIFNKNSIFFKIFKNLNILFIVLGLILLIIKFYFSLKLEQAMGPYIHTIKTKFYEENNFYYYELFCVFSSSFSDSILILSFITGIICLELIGYKDLFKYINNISLFYLFNFFIIIMVSTNNLLIMFLSFEFIFLPTIYYIYKLGYSNKIDKASEIVFFWTLFGSFIILFLLSYLFYNYNTLHYYYLTNQNFSKLEVKILFFLTLVGFGIKIPIPPFHFWLLKVHVEAPTAFSIFLSGFLVKSALYCLYMLISLYNISEHYFLLVGWVFFGLITATIGLSKPKDIKKLIAWATVQEMTFILIFLTFKHFFLTHTCILFILLHGLISTYMFYIVDIIQRRFKTRSLQSVKGIYFTLPKLTRYIWFLILLFSGLPLTAKFLIEWSLVILMIQSHYITLLYIIFLVNFTGIIFFCKAIFTLLYGVPEKISDTFIDIQKKEYYLLNMLIFLMLLLTLLIYIL